MPHSQHTLACGPHSPSLCPLSFWPRRLAKSTLLLIPLFGIHYMVFAVFPKGISAQYQILFELCVGSFQVGAGVARGCGQPRTTLTLSHCRAWWWQCSTAS